MPFNFTVGTCAATEGNSSRTVGTSANQLVVVKQSLWSQEKREAKAMLLIFDDVDMGRRVAEHVGNNDVAAADADVRSAYDAAVAAGLKECLKSQVPFVVGAGNWQALGRTAPTDADDILLGTMVPKIDVPVYEGLAFRKMAPIVNAIVVNTSDVSCTLSYQQAGTDYEAIVVKDSVKEAISTGPPPPPPPTSKVVKLHDDIVRGVVRQDMCDRGKARGTCTSHERRKVVVRRLHNDCPVVPIVEYVLNVPAHLLAHSFIVGVIQAQ